jgi:hypothetical protein
VRKVVHQNPEFARGFARKVLDLGHGAVTGQVDSSGKPVTWQARGRELFGAEVFNQAMRDEIAARKAATAEKPPDGS